MTYIVMPKLSDSMEEGTIIAWFKATGDQVEVGDELLEIETEKSTVPYIAETSGVLEIVVEVGNTVAVGEAIARVGDVANAPASETNSAAVDVKANGQATAVSLVRPRTVPAPATTIREESVEGDDRRRRQAASNGHTAAFKATPLARRMAAAHGVRLADVSGSGPLGRITRADVLTAAGVEVPGASVAEPRFGQVDTPASAADRTSAKGVRRHEPSRLQQLIARRMSEAKTTIPHFQVETEAAMDAALAVRAELKAIARDDQPVPSINDLIIKASAIALRDHPLANGSYRDNAFDLHDSINVGMAVAADDALVVPTIFDADMRSLGQIAAETRRLVASVRSGTIAPPELSGGTFTVSNLGMFGMTAITPVINPPQAAILGVGALRPVLARVEGEIVDRTLVTLTLSCDHRILNGADASRFLAEIRDLLERPLRLAL